jgi:hypothetical protein
MSVSSESYLKATRHTANDLKTILAARSVPALSHLTLPEIEQLSEQIAQVVPAGNIPGLILNGLIRLEGRQIPGGERHRHLGMLFRGVQNLLDKAVYGAVFAGPAAIILGYQQLLQLAGKDIDAAFPEGTWQFYLEYALREDTARHANETIGFQSSLAAHRLTITDSDALAAWIMAAMITLSHYPRLLENEWRERVYLRVLAQYAGESSEAARNAYPLWERQRPYVRGHDAGQDDYPAYRSRKFDSFFSKLMADVSPGVRNEVSQAIEAANRESLPPYLHQMNILARLDPDPYQETRVPFHLAHANVAVIYQGNYSLLPITTDVHAVRRAALGLLQRGGPFHGDLDVLLARAGRPAQPQLRALLDGNESASIQTLGYTPIILNWDRQDARLPLSAIRQTKRGIGDHALTLFFTQDSTVFDQSHIFFDGAWGAALAEIMTGEALSWAVYFAQLPPPAPGALPQCLSLVATPGVRQAAASAQLPAEAAAESTAIRLGPVMALRRLFKTRNDLINVTVNDLLVLYRSVHGKRYQPSGLLRAQVERMVTSADLAERSLGGMIFDAWEKIVQANPAILIPMDASQISPRERLFPTTFRNPMSDFLEQHDTTGAALRDYQTRSGERSKLYAHFDECQRHYLRMIASFGALMRRYKEVALAGHGMNTVSIKLLAYMPGAIQRLLDEIPGRFDMLNEIIKGEEVFSNVGRVAKGSTLRRFSTAKDDNWQKTLAWGVLTDDNDVMHISLRDFRPHVTALAEQGRAVLADQIAQDFLDAYTDGFNAFVRELREITTASRETRTDRQAKDVVT